MVLTAVAGVTLEEAGRAVALGACVAVGSVAVVRTVDWWYKHRAENGGEPYVEIHNKQKFREIYNKPGGRKAFMAEMDRLYYNY